jgi:23S rRNA pseudouridine1911/1915/1917 synthase
MKAQEWTTEAADRLLKMVKTRLEVSNGKARDAIRTGKVTVDGVRFQEPGALLPAGTLIRVDMAAPDPRRTEPLGIRVVHKDRHIIVIDKPAGLLSVPLPNSEEVSALKAVGIVLHGDPPPKPVHRLDKYTSGLMVFARTAKAAHVLRIALDAHHVRRTYRCVVRGWPEQASGLISSMLVRDTGKGWRGSRKNTLRVRPIQSPSPGPMPGHGKHAITRYETVISGVGRTALEVRLETGRTHQIRIHLAEIGCPVIGEAVYGRIPGAPRHALHAAILGFAHPVTGEALEFTAPWPADLAEVTPRGEHW